MKVRPKFGSPEYFASKEYLEWKAWSDSQPPPTIFEREKCTQPTAHKGTNAVVSEWQEKYEIGLLDSYSFLMCGYPAVASAFGHISARNTREEGGDWQYVCEDSTYEQEKELFESLQYAFTIPEVFESFS